jgi:GMP synthase-like glutamine amidotransferase
MRALAIVHQRDAGAGVFREAVRDAGWELDEWIPPEDGEAPAVGGYDAVMTFGGAQNAEDGDAWLDAERDLLRRSVAAGTPLLGLCLGAELVAEAAGGEVRRASAPEIGWLEVELAPAAGADPLFAGLPPSFHAFQWHSYEFTLPPGATELARSAVCPQGFALGRTWAIQFHPEVTLADAELWIDDYRSDPDAVAIGLDPDALRAETRERIEPWNELGRRICAGFLRAATDRA